MSKWFAGGSSESEPEESDEEYDSPGDDKMHLNSRFAGGDDTDDEEDVKRVVRSHKEKHLEALHDVVDAIERSTMEDNFITLGENFVKLNDGLAKWKKSSKSETVLAPPPYYEGLLMIQQMLTDITKEEKKNLDKKQSRAMNTLNQKFKKNLQSGGFKKEFEDYKAKNEKPKDGEDEAEQDVADDEEDGAIGSEKSATPSIQEDESEPLSTPVVEENEDDTVVFKKKKKKKKRGGTQPERPPPQPKAPAKIEWTEEKINEELKEVVSGRTGKKKLEKSAQIAKLKELLEVAKNVQQELNIRVNIISAHFEMMVTAKQHLSRENWVVTYNEIVNILNLLDKNRGIELKESGPSGSEVEERPSLRLVAFLNRLKGEMYKAFKSTDPHSVDYLERLCDEELLLKLARYMYRYYNRIHSRLDVAEVSLLIMSVIHYRRDALPDFPFLPLRSKSSVTVAEIEEDSNSLKQQKSRSETMEKLLTIVCADGNGRMKTQAILYTIYHHALEKRFFEARDLLLLSHLQDQVQHADIDTQILYNRATAQLGLCAFRCGRITDAHNCLSDLFQSNRVKELIAQGVTPRYGDRNANPDQEKIDKQRKMPYHLHMNLELLEVVHLVSAMLLETPLMVTQGYDAKRKIVSRSFRRLTDMCDRQVFAGPPESARDHVIAAARALKESDIDSAAKFLLGLNCWKLFVDCDQVKEVLVQNLREVGLQTFLLRYSKAFSSVSIDFLSAKFSLPPKSVHRILSRMMMNDEVQSCWHQPSGTVVMHQVEPNKLQSLTLQYADKIDTLVSENERSFDTRTGGFGYDKRAARDVDDDRKGGQGWGGRDRRDGGKYRDQKGNRGGGGYHGGGRQEFRNWENRRIY